jgi:hypothetical protein
MRKVLVVSTHSSSIYMLSELDVKKVPLQSLPELLKGSQ